MEGKAALVKAAAISLLLRMQFEPPAGFHDLAGKHTTDDLLDALRAHNILYDRDERGGEFFHAYTEQLDHRFFLEVVERRGGYDGYGAANAAVRLAAQAQQKKK